MAGLLLTASALGGCLPLPYLPFATNQITEETLKGIAPATSTRADVLLTLADPSIRGDKDNYFIYNWQQEHGGLVFFMGGGGGAAPVAAIGSESCNSLVIKFNGDGRVAAMRQFTGEAKGTGEMLLGKDDSGSLGGCSSAAMSRDIDAWLKEPAP